MTVGRRARRSVRNAMDGRREWGRWDHGSWNAVRRDVAPSVVHALGDATRWGRAGVHLGRGGRACCARGAQMNNLHVCTHDVSQWQTCGRRAWIKVNAPRRAAYDVSRPVHITVRRPGCCDWQCVTCLPRGGFAKIETVSWRPGAGPVSHKVQWRVAVKRGPVGLQKQPFAADLDSFLSPLAHTLPLSTASLSRSHPFWSLAAPVARAYACMVGRCCAFCHHS